MAEMSLGDLVRDFGAIEKGTLPVVDGIVKKGAFNIKKDWQARWKAIGPHVPRLAYAVDYDFGHLPGVSTAQIGPNLYKKQGWLGHELEYGTLTNAAHPGGQPALDAEAPKFEAAIVAAVDKMWSA